MPLSRGLLDEFQSTFPKLQRLLFVFFALSAVSVLAQWVLLQVSAGGPPSLRVVHQPRDGTSRSDPLLDSTGGADGDRANATNPVVSGPPPHGPGGSLPRKGDLYWPGLVALFGLSMSAKELRLPRRMRGFAVFTFLNFAVSMVMLVQKLESPPGVRHLLSFHCPVPAAEIAHFVRQQQRVLRRRLAAGLPGRGEFLPPLEEAWPVLLPRDATVDLCSPSWALGNAYLIGSSVLALWMHFYALRILRAHAIMDTTDNGDEDDFLGGGRIVVVDQGGGFARNARPRVAAVNDPFVSVETNPGGGSSADQSPRSFVPFAGLPRKLDF